MFCVNCGAQLEEGCKFCPYCGTAVVQPKKEEKIDKDDICVEFSSEGNKNDNEIRYAMPDEEKVIKGKKSRIASGLLGIFLGGLGVHNFYLGYTKKAVIQLVLFILGCCNGITAAIACIWGFIEGILILAESINVDADGNALDK